MRDSVPLAGKTGFAWTGDENPDWEKMGADYFIAPWERKRFAQKNAAKEKEVE